MNGTANENPNRKNGSHGNGFVIKDSATASMTTEIKDEYGLRVQMMRFIISGVIATMVGFDLTFIMLNPFRAANFQGKTVGWASGTITAYIVNNRWTFKSKFSAEKVLVAAILYLITCAAQVDIFSALQPWLVESWGWNAQWTQLGAFVVVQSVATVISFIIQRVFIFHAK